MSSQGQAYSHDKRTEKQHPLRHEVQGPETTDRLNHATTISRRSASARGSLTPEDVLRLQSAVGNRTVSKLLGAEGPARVAGAGAVRAAPQGLRRPRAGSQGALQRQEEEEEPLQMKTLQRHVPDGEGGLQAKTDALRVGLEGGPVTPEVQAAINRARSGGKPLESAVQKQMSETMGHDFSGVRVHSDSEADALNQQLSAKAFTTGRDLFFRSGAYNPGSSSGRELLAHELTHVVQQSRGRVGRGGGGMAVRSASDAFEQEADALARQATGVSHEAGSQATQGGIQRQDDIKPRQKVDNSWAVSRLVQTQPWEGPADYYYEDEEEAIQTKTLDMATTWSVQRASREGEERIRIESTTPSIQQAQVTSDGHSAVQRAHVAVGPLAAKDGKWHDNWYKRAFEKGGKSIDAHPKRHGKFHAHIFFDSSEHPGKVKNIGWGKTGNSGYTYHPGHPNTFTDNTGRPYEKDANHANLDEDKTWQAVQDVQKAWKGSGYALLSRNCQHFAVAVAEKAKK